MSEEICSYIAHGSPFALYRLPGEKECRIVRAAAASVLDSCRALEGRSGFVFAPFVPRESCPILLLEGIPEQIYLQPGTRSSAAEGKKSRTDEEKERYLHTCRRFISRLDSQMQKLVLSRREKAAYPDRIGLMESFSAALECYPNAFVYLFYTPQSGIWMGSTPEILLEMKEGKGHTVALAGTQPLENGKAPAEWSRKNRQEQEFVAEYLRDIFAEKGIAATEKGPESIVAGDIAHLKSDFFFPSGAVEHTGALIERLHPTPAVCGLPKTEACEFICGSEGYDRRYYSGFLGVLNHDSRTQLFVNLRCIEVAPSLREAAFYAGGGIMPTSVPEEEWRETERKMDTMRKILVTEKI